MLLQTLRGRAGHQGFARHIAAAEPSRLQCRCFAKKAGGKGKKQQQNAPKKRGGSDRSEYVFEMRKVSRVLPGGRALFKDVNLSFLKGAKIGVLGLNGSGKSSLLKIMAGLETDFDGTVWTQEGAHVKLLDQEPKLDMDKDVLANVMDGVAVKRDLLERYDQIALEFAEPDADFDKLIAEQAEVQNRIEDLNAWDLQRDVDMAMSSLRVPTANPDPSSLSGGERRRVALAKLLLEAPDLLLLDEPTNHLDAESVAWLEGYLQAYKGTLVCITHDRYFLENCTDWILELDGGRALPYKGSYVSWVEKKLEQLDSEKQQGSGRSKALRRELGAIKGGKGGDGDGWGEVTTAVESGAIVIPPPSHRLGPTAMTVQGLTLQVQVPGSDDDTCTRTLVDSLDFELSGGEVVGVVGANGTGKSTLLRELHRAAEDARREREGSTEGAGAGAGGGGGGSGGAGGGVVVANGSVEAGASARVGLVSQHRESLDAYAEKSVYECVAEGEEEVVFGDQSIHMRAFVSAFNLKGNAQQKRVKELSGGERGRTYMAQQFRRGYNVLLLDEPTNDLDVETLRSLEQAVQRFRQEGGSVVCVSHDRWFLDRVCTRTLVMEEGGKVQSYPGSWSSYDAWRKKNPGIDYRE